MAFYYRRASESGDPALRPASVEGIHTSAFRRQRNLGEQAQRNALSHVRATNEFGSAVAVATGLLMRSTCDN